MRGEQLGGLDVRITGGTDGHGSGTGPVIVLLHGFGAPGDDMVSLQDHLRAPLGARFVYPVGPMILAQLGVFESRAWWMIDLEKRAQEFAEGRSGAFTRDIPHGLKESRGLLMAMLGEMDRALGADPRRTVLGGFSQGAMLSCDVMLHTDRAFAGVVLLSGSLIARAEWLPRMPARKGLPIFQSHGTGDPLLPYSLAEQLRDHLRSAGLAVDWVPFRGGHEIPQHVLSKAGSFLNAVLAR